MKKISNKINSLYNDKSIAVKKQELPQSANKFGLAQRVRSLLEQSSADVTEGTYRGGPVSHVYYRHNVKRPNPQFETTPIEIIDGIPVFSKMDAYVENYVNIAHDHVSSLDLNGENPFMATELSEELEESTRKLIRRFAKPNYNILDVGVGTARLKNGLDNYNWYGIDISMEYLKIARGMNVEVAMSRIEDMPYVDNCFDMITCTDVLEHVLDLNYCTAQLLRVLKPGGVIIIRVPLEDYLDVYLDNDVGYEFIHLRKFDIASLRLHFEKIFNCSFVTSSEVAPVFRGAHTLNIASFADDNPIRNFCALNQDIRLDFLEPFIKNSKENISNWVSELQINYPDLYNFVKKWLVKSLEINVVFLKN